MKVACPFVDKPKIRLLPPIRAPSFCWPSEATTSMDDIFAEEVDQGPPRLIRIRNWICTPLLPLEQQSQAILIHFAQRLQALSMKGLQQIASVLQVGQKIGHVYSIMQHFVGLSAGGLHKMLSKAKDHGWVPVRPTVPWRKRKVILL